MTTFKDLGLNEDLLKGIEELGFINPTPIQLQAIPQLISADSDLLGLAQTGTGKTAAFGLPLLEKIDIEKNIIQGIIICPTRELCLQITEDLKKFSKYYGQLRILSVYGGASIRDQIRELRKGIQIVVATAGRMIDIIQRGEIKLDAVKYVVLDEADEMLNMGFKEDIHHILSFTPEEKNTWLFSATMPKEIRHIANQFMDNPIEVTVGAKNTTNENIEHQFYLVRSRDRYTTLKRMVDVNPQIYGIIFTRTKADAQEIAEQLIKDKYNADALHGDLTQQQRDKVMGRFRDKSLQLLVATDVAARGIDVDDITHVINYSLPDDNESYTHRSGRTARAGKKGICMSIIHIKEQHRITDLERMTKTKFIRSKIPTGLEVCEAQLMNIIHQIHEIRVDEEQVAKFIPTAIEEFQDLSKEELIKKLISQEFNHFLDYYKDAPDLNLIENQRRDNDKRNQERGDKQYTRLHINVGYDEGTTNANLLELVDSVAGIFKRKVGKIMIKPTFSYFEIEAYEAERCIQRLNNYKIGRKSVKVSIAEGENRSEGGGGDSSYKKSSYTPRSGDDRSRRPSSDDRGSRSFPKKSDKPSGGSGSYFDKPGYKKKESSNFSKPDAGFQKPSSTAPKDKKSSDKEYEKKWQDILSNNDDLKW